MSKKSINRFFIFGKSERIFIVVLLLMITAGALLAAFAPTREDVAMPEPLDSLLVAPNYVGPPSHAQANSGSKFRKRVILDLNAVDSATLTRVPGIGPSFSRRIIALRELLGGYYTVLQLQEVYGMDEDKFISLKPWFAIKTPPQKYALNTLKPGEIPNHRYLNWEQKKVMSRLLYRHSGRVNWKMLMRHREFSKDDSIRLTPYFPDKLVGQDSIQPSK